MNADLWVRNRTRLHRLGQHSRDAARPLFGAQIRRSFHIDERKRLRAALLIAVSIHALAFWLIGLSASAPVRVHSSPAVTWVIKPAAETKPDTHRIAADNQRAGAGNSDRVASAAVSAPSSRTTSVTTRVPIASVGNNPQKMPLPSARRTPANNGGSMIGRTNSADSVGLAARRDARAAYLASWRRGIEREGNKQFPARRLIAHAKRAPIVRVTLRADGTVQGVSITRSSGSPELDRAAVNIVHAAAPFSALPDALRHHGDGNLHLSYEWHFLDGAISEAE